MHSELYCFGMIWPLDNLCVIGGVRLLLTVRILLYKKLLTTLDKSGFCRTPRVPITLAETSTKLVPNGTTPSQCISSLPTRILLKPTT
jgi:hypothetical protein